MYYYGKKIAKNEYLPNGSNGVVVNEPSLIEA